MPELVQKSPELARPPVDPECVPRGYRLWSRLTTRLTRLPLGSVLPGAGRCRSTMPFAFFEVANLIRPTLQCAATIRLRATRSSLPFTAGTWQRIFGGGGGGG